MAYDYSLSLALDISFHIKLALHIELFNTFAKNTNNMGLVKEFKDFISKGNVMDLAVAVIIGAAFGKIVTSLVEDVITPALLTPTLKTLGLEKISELKTDGGILYGNFLASAISFLVIAIVIFLLVKGLNSLKKKEEVVVEELAGPTNEEILLTEIRDLLKNR